jgi:hypothetical protein
MEEKKTRPRTIEGYMDLNHTENFFDFSSGVDISEDEIQGRIIQLIKEVRALNITATTSISSGNCKVEVFYDAVDQRAEVCVSKNFKEATLYFKEQGIIDTGGVPLRKDPQSKKWNIDYKIIY